MWDFMYKINENNANEKRKPSSVRLRDKKEENKEGKIYLETRTFIWFMKHLIAKK